ncbi:DNA polymerase III subunit beta [Streptomyces sp. NPDC002476]|uniref:DNA polymerase III subunit beta n=1 Tax=Streptomyces sp. NPDC002476 TaxID=3364648 RepID=UPI0036893B32
MEFRIECRALTEAVIWAARVLPNRSTVPLLGGLLLEAEDGRLRISGLDYEASACIEVDAEIVRSGKALVMGRRLVEVGRVLPDGVVECVVEGSRFSMTGGSARFGLSMLPLDDYPTLPDLPPVLGEVDAEELADAVAQVSVAAGWDDSLPTLTGVRLALDGDRMTLAATDRYRFAVRTLTWKPVMTDVSADVLVSARRLSEITRSFGRSGACRLALDGGSAGFEQGGAQSTVRLLDGRLPRHDKLFAMADPVGVVADWEELAGSVARVAVVAEGGSPLLLTFSGGSLLLQAGYEDDVASQRLDVELVGADEMTVAFDPVYLSNALSSFRAPVVRLDLMGPGQRAMITGWPSREDALGQATTPAHQHLLMSVRPLV